MSSINNIKVDDENFKINNSLSDKSSKLIKENQQINYGRLSDECSEKINSIPNEYYIFISHASDGDGAFPDEELFVRALYKFLDAKYPGKIYLDLIQKPKLIYTEISRAVQLSTYGVFICSFRYIMIFYGKRKEPYVREFDTIERELNLFFDKEKRSGFCMIPVRYAVNQTAFAARGPFGGGTDRISIEEESAKTYLEKAEYVSAEIIKKINESESKRRTS